MQNINKERQLLLENRNLKMIWHKPWRLTPKYEILTLAEQISERKTRYNWNPRYKTQIDKFSHNLIIKYLDGLQQNSIIIQSELGINTQKVLNNDNLYQLYKNYLRFMMQFYKLIIQKKGKGKTKIKKMLMIIKDFNYLIGYRHAWVNVIKKRRKKFWKRPKRRKLIKLQRFGKKIAPTRRKLIKLRFLIDKLFRWLYKLPKAREYFGHYIVRKSFDYKPKTQIFYRKKLKIHIR